ncbi:hypothetical protein CVU75_02025, partial [Candidatus Dependentiae bacterium HGW-Dependentiae-1]
EGAHGVLFNITGGKNLSLYEVGQAASVMYEQAHEEANIILGSVIDEAMGDEVSVTIIATGFYQSNAAVKALTIQAVSSEKEEILACPEQSPIVLDESVAAVGHDFVPKVDVLQAHASELSASCLGAVEKPEIELSASEVVEYDTLAQGPLAALQHLAQPEEVVRSKIFDASSQQKMPEDEIIQAAQVVVPVSEKNAPTVENASQKFSSSGVTPVHQEMEQEYEAAGIDMNDLDVPTFLRKEKQQGVGE